MLDEYEMSFMQNPDEEPVMKQAKPKTPIQERAALRANEERRLETAVSSLMNLLQKHDLHGGDISLLAGMHARLKTAIKNQHIKDTSYAAYKAAQIDTSATEGEY